METKKQNKIYLDILNKFCEQNELCAHFGRPFYALGKSMATDLHTLVVTPRISGCKEQAGNIDKIKSIYPVTPNMNKVYEVSALENALDKCPSTDKYEYPTKKCEACNGFGMVDFEFSYNCKNYSLEEDCPICNGEGEIEIKSENATNIKKVYEDGVFLKMQGCRFTPYNIADLIYLAQKLNEKKVSFVYADCIKEKPKLCGFQIGEVEIFFKESNKEYYVEVIIEVDKESGE